ncbi:hypothetical protein F5J12DRAFT_786845 [Pisolithus orientalis]|uniref:uncharacterized protein n=1 Tax=Pisolithus orientalis TaxID=936130 RepID=UPI002224E462|nr:uncharacterized protein F5J12DRAFT_786845 [Pisolithus orientalis]KAI5988482.1 hypothetical protein F5J12DRAFT_786845 [Pisolithus orientalis]
MCGEAMSAVSNVWAMLSALVEAGLASAASPANEPSASCSTLAYCTVLVVWSKREIGKRATHMLTFCPPSPPLNLCEGPSLPQWGKHESVLCLTMMVTMCQEHTRNPRPCYCFVDPLLHHVMGEWLTQLQHTIYTDSGKQEVLVSHQLVKMDKLNPPYPEHKVQEGVAHLSHIRAWIDLIVITFGRKKIRYALPCHDEDGWMHFAMDFKNTSTCLVQSMNATAPQAKYWRCCVIPLQACHHEMNIPQWGIEGTEILTRCNNIVNFCQKDWVIFPLVLCIIMMPSLAECCALAVGRNNALRTSKLSTAWLRADGVPSAGKWLPSHDTLPLSLLLAVCKLGISFAADTLAFFFGLFGDPDEAGYLVVDAFCLAIMTGL